jgi:PAS domain S-box-containing protein
MNRRLPALRQHFGRMGMAYLVLVLSLIPTLIAYRRVEENAATRDRARFDQMVQTTRDALLQHIERYLAALRGLRGLFDANPVVSPDQWQKYARSIDLSGNYRGMLDVGFAPRVPRADKQRHIAAMRSSGFPNYTLNDNTDRDEYFPILYLSSATRSPGWAPGWDMTSESNRMAAMEQARQTDRPIATGKLTLLTAEGLVAGPGFVIFLPVYRNGVKPDKKEDRQNATIGFVFASILDRALGEIILGPSTNRSLDIEVFEGDVPSPEKLLFDGDGLLAAGNRAVSRHWSTSMPVAGLGRTWTLFFYTLPAFELDSKRRLPQIALLGGLTISLLLFGIVWAQVRGRSAAEVLSGELRQSEDRLKETNEELRNRILERRQAEDALAAEKERLAVTLRSLGDGVITADIQEKIVLLNKTAEHLTGWAQQDAFGRALGEVFVLLDENSRERLDWPAAQFANFESAHNCSVSGLVVSRAGGERFVIATGAPIHDQTDRAAGAVLVFRDVTENRKLEAELHKASKLESLGLLAGGIAHDFNNILTAIFGNISLAKMSVSADDTAQERLARAEQACMRAKEMTNQLLTFARGGAPIKRVRAVPQLLKDSCDLAVLGANVRCEFSYGPDLRPVEVDQGQITQVRNNLLLNAVQAMPGGGTVKVRADNVHVGSHPGLPLPDLDYVRISVQDQGRGIAAEHLPRVFDPFFTTKHKARGLGLATAYSIVRKHDGLIEVDSKTEQGAKFDIYLPVSTHPLLWESGNDDPLPTGQGRVLVMDDEPDILNLSHFALKRLGYQAELARDGAEAIRCYREAQEAGRPFSAVIMDLTVPGGMGGKEAIRHLLELDPQATAIVSSGYSNDPVIAEFSRYGFRGVVAKPYEIRELAKVLHDLIGSSADPSGTGSS